MIEIIKMFVLAMPMVCCLVGIYTINKDMKDVDESWKAIWHVWAFVIFTLGVAIDINLITWLW